MEILKSRPKQLFINVPKFWEKDNKFMLFDIDVTFLNSPRDTAEALSKYEYCHVLGVA
jgi:hypothetical protein